MTGECNYVSLAFMILAVLLIVLLPELSKTVPRISTLFTNNVNYMLLLTITICIILLDVPSGIMFALWVIYGTYYYQRSPFTDIQKQNSAIQFTTRLTQLTPSSGDVETNQLRVPIEKGLLEPFSNNMSSSPSPVDSCCSITKDTTTEPIVKSRSGYDVVGCRLDGMMAPQNTTMYGPPLSNNCYITENKLSKSGTGWYPINP